MKFPSLRFSWLKRRPAEVPGFSPNLRILIFAQPRTGSNAMTNVLNAHPSVNLMSEPFNSLREAWGPGCKNYCRQLSEGASLDTVMEEIHQRHNGFKTLCSQLSEAENKRLLTHYGYKVLFLHRKNQLKSAVSLQIANQTGIWKAGDKSDWKSDSCLRPLDVARIRQVVQDQMDEVRVYGEFLAAQRIEFLDLVYEEIFESSDAARKRKLRNIFDFLDLKAPSMKYLMEITAPSRKITSDDLYRAIPNLSDVAGLGNTEVGFLF